MGIFYNLCVYIIIYTRI